MLTLSSSNLNYETMLYLSITDCIQWPFVGGPFQDKGWFFHVDDDVRAEPGEPFADLYEAMNHAAVRGYSHILFYDLGDTCDGLPVFRDPELEELNGVFYLGLSEHLLPSDLPPISTGRSA